MSGKARNHTERFARILDKVGEYIRNAPGDELVDTAREEGRDLAEVNARIKALLKGRFREYQQKILAEARQGYQRELASICESNFHLPKTAKGRRSLFLAALAKAPQLQPAFTLQNRELTNLPDGDIELHLRKMAQLGLLKELLLPEEE